MGLLFTISIAPIPSNPQNYKPSKARNLLRQEGIPERIRLFEDVPSQKARVLLIHSLRIQVVLIYLWVFGTHKGPKVLKY